MKLGDKLQIMPMGFIRCGSREEEGLDHSHVSDTRDWVDLVSLHRYSTWEQWFKERMVWYLGIFVGFAPGDFQEKREAIDLDLRRQICLEGKVAEVF